MSIKKQMQTSIFPTPSSGVVTKLFGQKIDKVVEIQTNDICYCGLECEYVETVFATSTNEWWKNDKNSFLFRKYITSDTISLELWNSTEKIADITDNTYGDYYASFTNAPYVYFVVDWQKVKNLEGYGYFRIKAVQNIIGTSTTFESHLFRILPYSDILADKTVRIETYKTGNIISSPFDFSKMLTELPNGFYNSYRIRGQFGWRKPKIEIDNFLNQNYKLKQIQDKITDEWTLETNLIPASVSNILIYDDLLANRVLITDYNLMNNEIYRRKEVYPTEISDATHYDMNRKQIFRIKFVNQIENNIKNNY